MQVFYVFERYARFYNLTPEDCISSIINVKKHTKGRFISFLY